MVQGRGVFGKGVKNIILNYIYQINFHFFAIILIMTFFDRFYQRSKVRKREKFPKNISLLNCNPDILLRCPNSPFYHKKELKKIYVSN